MPARSSQRLASVQSLVSQLARVSISPPTTRLISYGEAGPERDPSCVMVGSKQNPANAGGSDLTKVLLNLSLQMKNTRVLEIAGRTRRPHKHDTRERTAKKNISSR